MFEGIVLPPASIGSSFLDAAMLEGLGLPLVPILSHCQVLLSSMVL